MKFRMDAALTIGTRDRATTGTTKTNRRLARPPDSIFSDYFRRNKAGILASLRDRSYRTETFTDWA
jgi:hypothetical protein